MHAPPHSRAWATAGSMLGQYGKGRNRFVAGLEVTWSLIAEEMFEFHRQQRQASTRAFHGQRALDLWVVDSKPSANAQVILISGHCRDAHRGLSARWVRNPLAHARDLRRLVVDALQGRCQLSPVGREIKPRVWVDDGARLHRRARVIAPPTSAGLRALEDTLITRFSNLESFCQVITEP